MPKQAAAPQVLHTRLRPSHSGRELAQTAAPQFGILVDVTATPLIEHEPRSWLANRPRPHLYPRQLQLPLGRIVYHCWPSGPCQVAGSD
jgi:hypothetical protein